MLMGEEDSQQHSLLQSAPFVCGCLAKALADKALTRQDVASALAQASLQPFLAHLTGQQLAWLQRHMQLTSQLTAAQVTLTVTSATHPYTPASHDHFYFGSIMQLSKSRSCLTSLTCFVYYSIIISSWQSHSITTIELHQYVSPAVTAATWTYGVSYGE